MPRNLVIFPKRFAT